jgi:hypothetical protein
MRSDKVFGDMHGDAENGKGEGKRQRGMQETAEIFVEFEKCHGTIPFADPPVSAKDSDQVMDDAQGDADQRNGERNGQRGMQEVAQIFFVENGHRAAPWICPP